MANLPKYTLSHDKKRDGWSLRKDGSGQTIETWDTKEDATAAGVLKKAVGPEGGTVRIEKKLKSGYEEERTYPRSRDPKKSLG